VIYTIYSYENLQPRQSLAEFIAEQTANSGLDVSSELKVTAGDFEGKQYSTSDTQRAARTEQFFATENHLYRFVAGTNPGAPPAQKFFGSIMLGKKEDGLEVVEGLPPAIPAGEKVFNTAEVDTKARLTDRPMPTYTDTAKAVGVTGAVNLKVLLGSDGRVTLVRVISGLPFGLTERAIQAAKATKFVPAIKDGKNVSTWVQMEFNFNLF
jgi:TonB family protein